MATGFSGKTTQDNLGREQSAEAKVGKMNIENVSPNTDADAEDFADGQGPQTLDVDQKVTSKGNLGTIQKQEITQEQKTARAERLANGILGSIRNTLIKEANLWVARRNTLAELAESQAKALEAPRDGSSQMFRPIGSNMPSIEARRKNVEDGFIPLTRTELDRFLSGNPLSPMASTSEKNAWIMAEVMLGRRSVKDIPNEYRRVMEVNTRQAARGRAAANQPPSSRSVSGFDYQGNFYTGSLGPSGAFSGIRQGPSGAGIINGNFDQNGGFVWPH
jgi:hypothetical protein